MRQHKKKLFGLILTILFSSFIQNSFSQSLEHDSSYVASHYFKYEFSIPMRDGVKLFTSVYVPRDTTQDYPILFNRTPYRVAPYGKESYKDLLGPSWLFTKEGYIFVYQDVRGKFMSEGDYANIRPTIAEKVSRIDIDESSDTYDTIEWLIKNIKHNNGKVGMWGVSYPGFYTSAALINAHPALKAASPQAPIGDWFIGDDMHHNGAFCLASNVAFFSSFGRERKELTTKWSSGFSYPTLDGYNFFLNQRTLQNITQVCGMKDIPFWSQVMKHGNYDDYWKSRTLLPHLKNIKPAVMTVAGLNDAEDLYGSFATYKTIEKQNKGINNILILGPWSHGQWERGDGDKLGNIYFGSKTSEFYRADIEFPFFNFYLKGKGILNLPEAYAFETGTNTWKKYDQWPPANMTEKTIYLHNGGKLKFDSVPRKGESYDEYVSDPLKPVPFSKEIRNRMNAEYMNDDQRFSASRPDVLVYQTDELQNALLLAGPVEVTLFVSTTGTDADFVVKLIDVIPDSEGLDKAGKPTQMCGYQMLVRGDIMRGKFRNSFENPEPFEPGKVTKVKFVLPDINHCFKKGHRLMVHVQSSWFPLFDINPQKFCDIYNAKPDDFMKAAIRIYNSAEFPSSLKAGVLEYK